MDDDELNPYRGPNYAPGDLSHLEAKKPTHKKARVPSSRYYETDHGRDLDDLDYFEG